MSQTPIGIATQTDVGMHVDLLNEDRSEGSVQPSCSSTGRFRLSTRKDTKVGASRSINTLKTDIIGIMIRIVNAKSTIEMARSHFEDVVVHTNVVPRVLCPL
jgi:uncharacterized protein (DUF111 family)